MFYEKNIKRYNGVYFNVKFICNILGIKDDRFS